MAGLARENVSRVLKDWTARSLMSRVDGHYCLQSKTGIARELELESGRARRELVKTEVECPN